MYNDLVMRLRGDASWVEQGLTETEHEIAEHIQQAAVAIEELSDLCASQSKDCSEAIAKYIELWKRQPQWIPVTERLPEEEKTVMTWGKEHQCVLLDWMHDNEWCCFGDADYWMPLPEPPEKEKT